MFILASFALVLCLALTIAQCVVVAAFLWTIRRQRNLGESDASLPKAAVVLALRGPDPFLDECLRRLLAQRYPDYRICLIVDSDKDPVLQDIERIVREASADRVVVSILEKPFATCSLKCSALIQAVRSLDPSYKVVAFLDGDALPHPTWLQELVAPLSDPAIGVTSGNRWYVPASASWGTWVRYCWNVGAVIQVWLNDIVWAGSMALRTETIEKIELLDAWSKALSVDATAHRQLRLHNYKVRFVPSVIMVNREAISLPQFVRWVQRQLVAAKSCGSSWRLVGFHAANLAGAQLLALLILLGGCLTQDMLVVVLASLGLAAYWGSALLAIIATEWTMRRTIRGNGEQIQWNGVSDMARLIPALLLTQIAYPYALSGALFRRRVSWRGIEYDVRGVNDVRMLDYHPYVDSPQGSASESIV